jgi:membrane protease YdiL (CAAX protease family)
MNPEELTPNQQAITILASLIAIGLVFGSLIVHAWVLVAWQRVMSWGGWLRDRVYDKIGLIDLFMCLVFIAVAQIAVAVIFRNEIRGSDPSGPVPSRASEAVLEPAIIVPAGYGSPVARPTDSKPAIAESPWFMVGATFSLVAGCIASALWTLGRTHANPRLLGMSSGNLARDLMVGVLVFLWITPLVLMVNVGVSQMTEVQYEHPVIDSLRGRSWAFPLLFLSAVIFAPLWEEYAFRFLLVNWLDTLRRHGLDLKRLVFGQVALATNADTEPSEGYPPWWIAIVSGLLFGLAHFEYGVSWVPLVVLGTVLARVYQLQRSILPCFLIHALFNSLAMVGFAFELFVKSP